MNLYGRLMVNLSEENEFDVESFAGTINSVIKPPCRVGAEDIFVRAIYLVSDRVNSYGGRFPEDELRNLCDLIIDSPVLVGHNKNELPIARNFKAEVIEKGDEKWVKVWFYWLKESEGSQALLANIDGGIYKEGSIGFIFSFPECGICGEDIRNCSHTPLKKYPSSEGEIRCHYNYRKIKKVLETSLVFRGATPNTRTTNELVMDKRESGEGFEDLNSRKMSYRLKRIKESAIIEFEHAQIPYLIIFPQFNSFSLHKNKVLVGYPVSMQKKHELKLGSAACNGREEHGSLAIEKIMKRGFILSLKGRLLNGRYMIRPAFWDRKKLVLFSRLV